MSAKALGVGLVLVLVLPAHGQDGPEAGSAELRPIPVPQGTVFQRHEVFLGDRGPESVAGKGEVLIYSNTQGALGIPLGAGLGADDIATVAADGCGLRRFEFPVMGRVDPARGGGPYTVNWAFYRTCPQAVPGPDRPALVLAGTDGSGSFPDDSPRTISVTIAGEQGIALSTNVWFAVSFNRANAGVVGGNPPLLGMSCDHFDYQGSFPCGSGLGGYPDHPQASFNLQMWADAGTCTDAFVGYKNTRPSGPTLNPGYDVYLIDDIELGVESCEMIAYEVALLGQGFYTMEMRNGCETLPIPGTQKFFGNNNDTVVQTARFAFDPPITLPRDFFFAGMVNNSTASYVVTGRQACVGATADSFFVHLGGTCSPVRASQGLHAGLDLTITCAGRPPVGACCDEVVMECEGGPDDGKPCCPVGMDLSPYCLAEPTLHDSYPACTSPGTCEAVCRELPEMNCPWPPRFSTLQPQWAEGASCNHDPFPLPCGVAACCRPDQVCENLTQNECNAVPPLDRPRLWGKGRFCDLNGQRCPFVACLTREGECAASHDPGGCPDYECCSDVCDADSWCCLVEWDRVCVQLAEQMCPNAVGNDECNDAVVVEADSSTFMSNLAATESDNDPGYCCRGDTPDAPGLGTAWFRFVATDTSARVSTCNSDPAHDSLFQVFAVGDPSTEETACATLSRIACSDDVEGCSTSGHHGQVCITGLTPGDTYYVMLAAKTPETKGLYELEIRSPCFEQPIWNPNDCNENKLPDGCELGRGTASDCNRNDILDECEIASGGSFDCDGNGFLDECVGVLDTLAPSPPLPSGAFGSSVVMDEHWIVVGTGNADPAPPEGYPLYVFKRTLRGWQEAARFYLPDIPAFVDMDEGWIVTSTDPNGLAYLLRLDGENWIPAGMVQGPVLRCTRYGAPVAIDGDTIALGTGFCQDCQKHGTMYQGREVVVLRRKGSSWIEEARLLPPPGYFSMGGSVAVDGDGVLVGAPECWWGTAFVFRRTGTTWEHEATLIPYDGAGAFGRSVALSGDIAIVGATVAGAPNGTESGAVYVFRRAGFSWLQEGKLTPSDAAPFDRFGWSVGFSGNTIVVGAYYKRTGYVFHRHGREWIEEAKLLPPATSLAYQFGNSVSTDGSLIVVGAPGAALDTSSNAGVGYVFQPARQDCNQNDVPDLCDLRDGKAIDCNQDDVPDECTLADGTSPDCNGDGTLDECQVLPPAADVDFDGDTDLLDLAAFMRCYTGPGKTTLGTCCGVFDIASDSAVDGLDFRGFFALFEGP